MLGLATFSFSPCIFSVDFLLRLQTAKQKSSTADRILPLKSPEKEGVAHVPTALEVDKGKKNLDAVETIALIIDKLQHVTISFQQSRASLPSMLPPEILKKGMTQSSLFKNQEMQELCWSEMGLGIYVSPPPCLLGPELKEKKNKGG